MDSLRTVKWIQNVLNDITKKYSSENVCFICIQIHDVGSPFYNNLCPVKNVQIFRNCYDKSC